MDLSCDTVAGAPRLDGKTFFGLHIYFAKRFYENLQSAKGPSQSKSGPVNNMVSKRKHLLYHFSITIHIFLASFCATIKLLKKNQLWEVLIDPIIEFELRGPEPMYYYKWLFS